MATDEGGECDEEERRSVNGGKGERAQLLFVPTGTDIARHAIFFSASVFFISVTQAHFLHLLRLPDSTTAFCSRTTRNANK